MLTLFDKTLADVTVSTTILLPLGAEVDVPG